MLLCLSHRIFFQNSQSIVIPVSYTHLILFGLGIVTAGIIAGCFLQYRNETTNKECTRQLFAMDTVMSFTAYGKNSEQAVDAAMKEVQRLDDLLSTGDPDSEVSQILSLIHI